MPLIKPLNLAFSFRQVNDSTHRVGLNQGHLPGYLDILLSLLVLCALSRYFIGYRHFNPCSDCL